MQWEAVDEIVAYKRDMIATDDICLGFRARGSDDFYSADEDMPGWVRLQQALRERFGIRREEWLAEVTLPPFATNWTVLWTRAGGLVPGPAPQPV
jgi:hypothetical protein